MIADLDGRVALGTGAGSGIGLASVVLIPTYGHTPGHQSVRVRTENAEFVLCGDACYLKEALETMTLPGIIADPDGVTQAFQLFCDLQSKGAAIMYGHDLEFWKTVPQAPARLGSCTLAGPA